MRAAEAGFPSRTGPRRSRRVVLGVWAAIVLAALPFAANQADKLSGGGFQDMDAQSGHVDRAIQSHEFPGLTHSGVLATVLVPQRDARPADLRRAVARVARQVSQVDGIAIDPAGTRPALASARANPHRPVVIPLDYKVSEQNSIDLAKRVQSRLGISGSDPGTAAGGRVNVHLVGQGALWAGVSKASDEDAKRAEARGFPIVAIVLLVVFGSVAAAALPLSLGMAAVIVTGAIIYALSQMTLMSVFVTSIASMIGIGVAVDYSLFILVRYREEIRAGHDPTEARATAMATSGRAVTFSGLTVAVSLAALFLIHSTGIRSMAAGAIVVVAIAVLAASTLLPAMMALLGRRAYEPGRLGRVLERRRGRRERTPERAFWSRWTRAVMRRPAASVVAATALLLGLAVPALSLEVHDSATGQLPRDHEVRQGLSAAAKALGPGAVGPAYVVVDLANSSVRDAAGRRTVRRVKAALAHDPLVRGVSAVRPSKNGRSALMITTFRVGPESQAARDTVDRLRVRLHRVAGADARVAVGGTTAVILDFDRFITGSLWRLVLFVLAMSFVVLLVLLRSLILPLKATLMNVLTVAASYGVLVAVFQLGWLGFLGVDKKPIYPFALPLVLVLAFGLSMDYHIFLLSRIRERYSALGDNRNAVAEALAASATPITSAALIMVAVFSSFVSAGQPAVQQLGLAAAVAIALDATIVRLVIVPAAMELLGKWNWWLPSGLARLLPTFGSREPAFATAPVSDDELVRDTEEVEVGAVT